MASDDDVLLALVSLTGMAEACFGKQACLAYIATLSLSARDIPSPRLENLMAAHGGADVIIVSDGNAFKLRNTP